MSILSWNHHFTIFRKTCHGFGQLHLLNVLSVWLHELRVLWFRFSFFNESSRLRFGDFKSCSGVISDDLSLYIGDDFLLFLVGLSFFQNLGCFSLWSKLSEMLLIFSLDDSDTSLFQSINLFDLHGCLHLNLSFHKSNFLNIEVMLQFKENLVIISLDLEKMLVHWMVYNEHLMLLPSNLLLEINIVVGRFHQADS